MAADRNDPLAADDACGHDRRQTDAAYAEDCKRIAEPGVEHVHDRTETGQEAAAQGPKQAEIDIGINNGDLPLIRYRVCRKRGLPEEHGKIAAVFLVKTGRAVRMPPEEVQRIPGVAARRMTAQAVVAVSAVLVGQYHVVAGLDALNHVADLLDDAGALMAKHAGDRPRRHLVTPAQVRVAASGRDNFYEYLVCLRLIQYDLFDRELALFIRDSCFD